MDIVIEYLKDRRGHWVPVDQIEEALRRQCLAVRPAYRCKRLAQQGIIEKSKEGYYRYKK